VKLVVAAAVVIVTRTTTTTTTKDYLVFVFLVIQYFFARLAGDNVKLILK
jgi:hypothetical protein